MSNHPLRRSVLSIIHDFLRPGLHDYKDIWHTNRHRYLSQIQWINSLCTPSKIGWLFYRFKVLTHCTHWLTHRVHSRDVLTTPWCHRLQRIGFPTLGGTLSSRKEYYYVSDSLLRELSRTKWVTPIFLPGHMRRYTALVSSQCIIDFPWFGSSLLLVYIQPPPTEFWYYKKSLLVFTMKFLTFSLISVLFVSRGFAWPSRLANREASRRLRGSRPLSSSPHAVVNSTSNGTDSQSDPKSYAVTSSGTTLYDEYSTNWAGVVIESPPTGQNFTTVSGTFIVPKPTGSNGSASAWVGIDGDTASQSILQAGVDFTISGGKVSYDSWYEWWVLPITATLHILTVYSRYPNYAYDFSNFAISAGNTITITIHSTSSKAGVVTLLNKSTGKSVSQSLTAPSSSVRS